jgi:hypothetical protein
MKNINHSLALRLVVGILLLVAGIPWYPNIFAIAISIIGAFVLIFVRVETFRQANEAYHKRGGPSKLGSDTD